MSRLLAPSILSADFGFLKEQIEIINQSEADFIHVDVMDGVFVPNISFGFTILDAIAPIAKKPLDIHLMIVDPDRYIERFASYKPAFLTVHYETCIHLHRTLNFIRSLGVKSGVALNPHTPVEFLKNILNEIDLILLMSVNPGFGGQKFIEQSYEKIRITKKLISDSKEPVLIETDGGIGKDNINLVYNAGTDIVVAGNAIFKTENIKDTINLMKKV